MTDYLWERSVEIEPRSSSDTVKRRNAERRWPGLPLKSPGIKPRTLPGKNPPHPLPKISSGGGSGAAQNVASSAATTTFSSRQSKDESSSSPLNSPSFGGSPSQVLVFRQSPVSTPLTPGGQTSPRDELSSSSSSYPRDDPIKIYVILTTGPISGGSAAPPVTTAALPPPGKAPPLPPKPRGGSGLFNDNTPPLPPRDVSPPPPIPPRLPPARVPVLAGASGFSTLSGGTGSVSSFYMSSKPPFESRHPLIEPVFPRRNASLDSSSSASSLPPLVPRSRNNNGGEPSPATAGVPAVAGGAPFRWCSESPSTSPHYSRHHHPLPHPPLLPPPPPAALLGSSVSGERVGSAPGSASWDQQPPRPSPSNATAAAVQPTAAAAPLFFNGPVSAGLEMGSHFVFGHHLHAGAPGQGPKCSV